MVPPNVPCFDTQVQSVEAFLNGPIEVMRQRILRGTSAVSARQLALSGHRGTITHHEFLTVRCVTSVKHAASRVWRAHRQCLSHGRRTPPRPVRAAARLTDRITLSPCVLQTYQHQIPAAIVQMIQRISLNRLTVSAWLAQVGVFVARRTTRSPRVATRVVTTFRREPFSLFAASATEVGRLFVTGLHPPCVRRISMGPSATARCRRSWPSRCGL